MKKAPKAGRPQKKYGRREFPVGAKMTAEEKERLERAADAAKMSLSDFIRSVLDAEARRVLGET